MNKCFKALAERNLNYIGWSAKNVYEGKKLTDERWQNIRRFVHSIGVKYPDTVLSSDEIHTREALRSLGRLVMRASDNIKKSKDNEQ